MLLSGRDFRDASTRPPSVLELSATEKQRVYQHGQSLRNRIPVSHARCDIQPSELVEDWTRLRGRRTALDQVRLFSLRPSMTQKPGSG